MQKNDLKLANVRQICFLSSGLEEIRNDVNDSVVSWFQRIKGTSGFQVQGNSVDTRRRFNVYKTSIRRRQRRIDVL